MKRRAFLTSLYLMFLTKTLLTIFLGQTGVAALGELQGRVQEMEQNLLKLQDSRNELNQRFESLRVDSETLLVEARSLWLFKEGDKVIHIQKKEKNRGFIEGDVITRGKPWEKKDSLFRMAALVIGILSFFALWMGSHTLARHP